MTQPHPLVSVGLPVRNGENFLAQALESLRAQTLRDLEVVVSDNACTDATAEIIARARAVDPRIRSLRQDENVGAAANFNLVFDAAGGRYFCWTAHDDLWSPEFLTRGVEILEADSGAILCFPGCSEVDADLRELRRIGERPALGSEQPHVRLRDVVQHTRVRPIFGLVRTDALRRTRLMQPRVGRRPRPPRRARAPRTISRDPGNAVLQSPAPGSIRANDRQPRPTEPVVVAERRRGPNATPPHWARLVDYGRVISRVPMPRDEWRRCWVELSSKHADDGDRWPAISESPGASSFPDELLDLSRPVVSRLLAPTRLASTRSAGRGSVRRAPRPHRRR